MYYNAQVNFLVRFLSVCKNIQFMQVAKGKCVTIVFAGVTVE